MREALILKGLNRLAPFSLDRSLCYNPIQLKERVFMADITLHTKTDNQVTCVSNVFIDEYMKEANGEYVKIYLYLLRALSQENPDFSISHMADELDHTQRDIRRALNYWSKKKLLSLEYDDEGELQGICLLEPRSAAAPMDEDVSVVKTTFFPPRDVPSPLPTKRNYSPSEILELKEQSDVGEMLFVIERYFGHPLNTTELNTIFYWYDGLGMSAGLISRLVETCIDKGHNSVHYMNTVALDWATKGIKNIDDFRDAPPMYSRVYYAVTKGFGISGRVLTKAETEYIDRWTGEYGFDEELIGEACKRTILKTGKASFPYAESILKSWKMQGVKNLGEVLLADENRAAAGRVAGSVAGSQTKAQPRKEQRASQGNKNPLSLHNFDERSYDFANIEAQILAGK